MEKDKFTIPVTPAGWELCLLRHEEAEVIVELHYLQNQLTLLIENSKVCQEYPCKDLNEAKEHVIRLFGKNRTDKIFSQWHEISYRRNQ